MRYSRQLCSTLGAMQISKAGMTLKSGLPVNVIICGTPRSSAWGGTKIEKWHRGPEFATDRRSALSSFALLVELVMATSRRLRVARLPLRRTQRRREFQRRAPSRRGWRAPHYKERPPSALMKLYIASPAARARLTPAPRVRARSPANSCHLYAERARQRAGIREPPGRHDARFGARRQRRRV